MADLLNQLANGTLLGLLYALIALGFAVVYRASKVFNMAQGEFVVLGGFIVWWLAADLELPLLAAVPLALVGAGIVGLAIERTFFARMVGESSFAMVMVTIALLILIRGVILVVWGPEIRPFPIVFPLQPLVVGDVLMPRSLVYGGAISIVTCLGLSWFFSRTRLGLALTAVSQDHQVALSLGISVRRAMIFAWVLGSVISAVGAIIYLSGKSLNFLASDIGFAALPVALLAGLESVAGLLIGGILVGIAQALAQHYLDPAVGANVASLVPSLFILLVLFVRPTGLFGWKTIERV